MSSSWLGLCRQEQMDKAVVREFNVLVTAAKNILETAKNEETRNKVIDRQVTTAFKALTAKMRWVKKDISSFRR